MLTAQMKQTIPAEYDESCRHCGGEHVAGEPSTYCGPAKAEYDRATDLIDGLKSLGL